MPKDQNKTKQAYGSCPVVSDKARSGCRDRRPRTDGFSRRESARADNRKLLSQLSKAKLARGSLRSCGRDLVESITVNVWTQLDSVTEMVP